MKQTPPSHPRRLPVLTVAALAALTALSAPSLQAQTSDTWKSTVLGGDWHTADNWTNGSIPGGGGTATFNPATGATEPSVITLDEDVTLSVLSFANEHTATTGWTFGGDGKLIFSGSASPNIQFTSSTGQFLRITNAIEANSGLTLWGANSGATSKGVLRWDAASTSFSDLRLNRASISVDAVANKLGSGTLTLVGITGTTETTNRIFLTNANPSSGSSPHSDGAFSNNLILGNSVSALVGAFYDDSRYWNINVTGTISQNSAVARAMNYYAGSGGNGGTRFVVSGDNSYTGDTSVGGGNTGPIMVRATHNNAFGTGTTDVILNAARDTVELSNNVTIANKTLKTKGTGYNNRGALNNISGDNEWSGDIELGGGVANAIGAEDGSSLLISGEISGSELLRKVGTGTLILDNNNAFTGGLEIVAGRVVANSAVALGDGNVSLTSSEGDATLEIGQGLSIGIDGDLNLSGNSGFTFDLTGVVEESTRQLTVIADQTGDGTYRIELLGAGELTSGIYHLLSVTGSHEALGFSLDTSGLQGHLIWQGGLLSYNAEAIPEPGTIGLALLGLGGLAAWQRFRSPRRENA